MALQSQDLPELLRVAAQRGYLEDLKTSVNESASIATDDLGNTLLHVAAGAGHFEVVNFLLTKSKAPLGMKNHIGDTPLHKAAFRGYIDIAKLLLKNGADPQARNKDNKIPGDLARDQDMKTLLLPHDPEDDEEIKMEDDDD